MRAQEVQLPPPQYRTQRRTQPLDPQVLAEFERDQDIPTDEPPIRAPRIPRQPVMRERELAPNYFSISLPTPMPPRSVCPICKGAGYLRVDVPFGHPNFGKPIPCECKEAERKEKRRQQLIELSDLSAFHNKSFKNFNPRFPGVHPSVQEGFQEAYRFAHNPNGWLVLIGPNGCGKTHLAAAIANQTLSDGAVVLFTVVPDLLAHLRATFGPTSPEGYEQRFSKMREAEVLILDDLGAHQSSPWANEKLFQLLNYRYNSAYPTVITANKQGLSSLDERILSRISDNALVTRIIMNGALDYRPQNPRR
jgi:DNA replication protein DnaC